MSGDLGVGQSIGGYRIVGVAGLGGMGVVYRAEQSSLGRTVALKVIRDVIADSGDYRSRFLREARLAAAVNHPHVVSVFDVGEHEGRLYLTMQWIAGADLRAMLESQHRLDPERTVRIGAQLARALNAVHEAGLVHRDVKPSNVLVRDIGGQDHAYLTDFGVAKMPDAADDLTRTGFMIGTPGYLAPEQIQGGQPAPRSDLYALGCVIFEALTGQRPFAGDNDLAVRWAHANSPRPVASAVCPDLGTRYDAFFARALAIDPADRFASGQGFADALQSAHDGASSGRSAGSGTTRPGGSGAARDAGPTVLTPETIGDAAGRAVRRVSGAGRAGQAIVLIAGVAFIASVTALTRYTDSGDRWVSLRQATSGDQASPLHPADFWTVTGLTVFAIAITVLGLRRCRRATMIAVAMAAVGVVIYTLSIPRKGAYPGFGSYGSSYWISLVAAAAMAFGAVMAVVARRTVR